MSIKLPTVDIEIKVHFYHVDPMQVVWHGNYVQYFEQARCVLLDQIDYNYPQMQESGYMWPVIDMAVRYVAPARFGQIIVVSATMVEYENRLKIDYRICDKNTRKRLTKGHTVQVAVDIETQEMCLASPDILYQKLGFGIDP